ncbi:MAG: right-handed parallel beta-helix repeat-containing protein [Phycisphaerae bacterium]|nr:right-handed parallel beta-helix repeat-containing protein [Phycisphaerae bacterium]
MVAKRSKVNALLGCLLCSILAKPSDAGTIFVKADATGANNGATWADAYTDLQSALAVAVSGDEIWVAEGTYKPGSLSTSTFQLKNQVSLYGGFAGTESEREQRDWAARPTILSGDLLGDDNTTIWYSEPTRLDNSKHVLTAEQTVTSGTLDGFVIEGGNANSTDGGGIVCNGASLLIANCTLRKNASSGWGGGCRTSGPISFIRCVFTNNASSSGAGLYSASANLTLTDCAFDWNYAQQSGSGLYCTGSVSINLSNCIFSNGDAWFGSGGAIYCTANVFRAVGCLFSGNTALNSGGGVYLDSASVATLSDCVLVGNEVWHQGGGGVYAAKFVSLGRCTFQDNIAWYSAGAGACIQQGSSPISECRFIGNEAGTDGGGIYIGNAASSPAITGCIFSGNLANRGGAIYSAGYPAINRCFLSGNSAQDSGGGLYSIIPTKAPVLYNCLFTGNTAGNVACAVFDNSVGATLTNCTFNTNLNAQGGEALLLFGGSANKARVTNCIFWGHATSISGGQPAVTYTCIQGGHDGTGNIDRDPLFVDADGPDDVAGTEDDNLHLSESSPCIDAGYNYACWLAGLTVDFDGNPRFSDCPAVPDSGNGLPPIVDMGAYEWIPPDADGDHIPDGSDQCFGTIPGVPVDATGCPAPIPGDFDRDGDIDDADVDQFEACATGPGISQSGDVCAKAKVDGDDDVDQIDFAITQRCYSGENVPADPNCAN